MYCDVGFRNFSIKKAPNQGAKLTTHIKLTTVFFLNDTPFRLQSQQ